MATTADLLDYDLIAEIKRVAELTGRHGLLAQFVRKLESDLASFDDAFSQCAARGDARGAALAAHTLKGSCRQLGACALGELFAGIERSAREGSYAEAKRALEHGAALIERSLQALKQA
jgi:HPt (histidine-containing phosphotransfer) domain-containing protein